MVVFQRHRVWKTGASSEPYAPVTEAISSTRFRDDQLRLETDPSCELMWDSISETPWYRWHDGTDWHQVWFDNAVSLDLKFQFADNLGLQGVGMWALLYDGDRPELWDVLEARYFAGLPPYFEPPDDWSEQPDIPYQYGP